MEILYNADGTERHRSRNLAGIRRAVGKYPVKEISVSHVAGAWEGVLGVIFEDGANQFTRFASYSVLCNFVRNWRNTYGATLRVNGNPEGTVSYRNPALVEGAK